MLKKIGMIAAILLLAFLFYHLDSVIYGLRQAKGQAKVLWQAQDLDEYLLSNNLPDSVIYKIELIKSVKVFSVDQLGLKESKNYTSIYDQKGKPILWMLTASPPYEIKAYEWEFPIAGSFPYKGFFRKDLVQKEAKRLEEQSFDTEIREVSAWSTLGWFSDPILSSMLDRDEGSLAELIIHELSHATIYLKDQVQLNENLANFIGKQGAQEFLISRFGQNSDELNQYLKSNERKLAYSKFLCTEIPRIQAFYENLRMQNSPSAKKLAKDSILIDLNQRLVDHLKQIDSSRDYSYLEERKLNNAYLSGFGTYSLKQDSLKQVLIENYRGNLKDFILDLRGE